jgi:hypothetical protein
MPGANTFPVEVTNLTKFGLWLMLDNEELYMDYQDFPWFRNASAQDIFNVERPSEKHLYWPTLDIDLTVDSIRRPQDFPLLSQQEVQHDNTHHSTTL